MWGNHRALEDTTSGYSKTLVNDRIFFWLGSAWAYLHRFGSDFNASFFLGEQTAVLIDAILLRLDGRHIPRAVAIGLHRFLWHVLLATFFQRRDQYFLVPLKVLLFY